MQRYTFPQDFIWGAITSSYQIEGAWNEQGKGESIWDRFSHTPGNMLDQATGDIACDHFHRYLDDIKLMKKLGLKSYSLSIAWPRILPDGKGQINSKGIDFYKRLINELLENNIKPLVTLNHWDLPQKLQDIGGWTNRDITDYFQEYAEAMFKELSDVVPLWVTHSEPWVISFLGYWYGGKLAPGIKDFSAALLASYNLLLSHGKAVEAYRGTGQKGEIGISLNLTPTYPYSERKEDAEASTRWDGHENRWFLDPLLKGCFPQDMLEYLSRKVVLPEIRNEDLKVIKLPIDFLGVNYYSPNFVIHKNGQWPLDLDGVDKEGLDLNGAGWTIYPEGLYDLLIRLDKEYNGVKIIITENGVCFDDLVNIDGKIIDDKRLDFIRKHLEIVHRAISDGVNLSGYYVWSLLDNLEWQYGYKYRFGIVHVDYQTQKRTVKKSGDWYAQVIRNNGF